MSATQPDEDTVVAGLTQTQFAEIRDDPRLFARWAWNHPNDPSRPYDFKTTDAETKLNYLLHEDSPLNPENWGNINVLKFARGCLKSTALRLLSNWAMFCYPNVDIYMTAPREGQITNFTSDLEKNIRESGLDNRQEKDNKMYKRFEVENEGDGGRKEIYEANFQADSGWGEGDALRGPHSHIGIIDEFQDISKPAFDVFVQCIDRSLPNVEYFPAIFIIGTPKLEGSFYHSIWEDTDQKHWDRQNVTWDQRSEPTEYLPSEELVEEMGVDVDALDAFEVRGWHLDQFNSPLHDAQAIARDRENFTERKFQNEVAARFYSPEDNLLARRHVRGEEGICDPTQAMPFRRQHDDSSVGVYADWGGGDDKNAADTVILTVEWLSHDDGTKEATVLDLEFLEHGATDTEEVRKVEEKIRQYDADNALVDYGHGTKAFQDLQDGVGTVDPNGYAETVTAVKYGNVADAASIKWESSSGQRRFFTCDKAHSITQMAEAVKDNEFVLPSDNLAFDSDTSRGAKLVNQLTAPYKELKTTPSGMKKVRVHCEDNRNDDAADCFTFAWLDAHRVNQGTISAAVSVSH